MTMRFIRSLFTKLLNVCLFTAFVCVSSHANAQIFSGWFGSDDEAEEEQSEVVIEKTDEQIHQAAFGEIVYEYFQEDYQQVLTLIEVGQKNHQFSLLNKENTDRLKLMLGAAQLQLGLYKKSQAIFGELLSQATSDYVQANTWFFMAKAGFENKQAFLTERAYAAIQQGDLQDSLSKDQWYELMYLTAYTRMQIAANADADYQAQTQSEGDNSTWQALADQIPQTNIHKAYLFANHGTNLFNLGNYEAATNTFTQAKQALIAHQNRRGLIIIATSIFDSMSRYIQPWTWFDANATAQQAAQEREQDSELAEQNALFDRINIGLGQSLLQQSDLQNAVAVLQNVAQSGGETEQALLTYGWANARENRWQPAMAAWQYLQNNSVGLFALQASYGLAYAFSQQDNLGQAFFALRSTADQIDDSLGDLDEFAVQVQQQGFFDQYATAWPNKLRDLKLGFFEPQANFDAQYLLSMRTEASIIMQDIEIKNKRLDQLRQLLNEREQAYQNRTSALSVEQARAQIEQTQAVIEALEEILNISDDHDSQITLAKRMAKDDMRGHIERVDNAQGRLTRLQNDTTRKRPLRASYSERVNRIKGIIQWQLLDTFVADKWEHQRLLQSAQSNLEQTQNQYDRLIQIQQNTQAFAEPRTELSAMTDQLANKTQAAQSVFDQASGALVAQLLILIEQRKVELKQQSVNTRLAMLRIQDLRDRNATGGSSDIQAPIQSGGE